MDEEGQEKILDREGKQGIYEEERSLIRPLRETVGERNNARERKEDEERKYKGIRDQHKEPHELRRDTSYGSYGQEQEEVIGGNNPLGFLAAGLRLLSFLVNNPFLKRETKIEILNFRRHFVYLD